MDQKIFNNTQRAFVLKSDAELKRSIFIFRMMSRDWMVSLGTRLTKFAIKFRLPVKNIIRNTIFNQFCGGETRDECLPVIQDLYEKGVYTVFDFASEIRERSDAEYDRDIEIQFDIANFAKGHKEIPFVAVKPTQIAAFATWEKATTGVALTAEEEHSWEKAQKRLDDLCKLIYDLGGKILVDAEESWMQTAVDDLVEEMMEKYNQERDVVFGTVQCYRWDRPQYMFDLHKRAKAKGFKIGMKIVRGAYMEKERNRAQQMGYPDPICRDKAATDDCYNSVMRFCIEQLDDISVYIGTHNEESTFMAMQMMEERDIQHDDDRIWFSQLYGMSDNISFNLGAEGYNSAKYLPFGKVEEVIPYLIRRAEENSSVKGQTGRELSLLLQEKKRRKKT